ncbi:MspA family porin [Antrihabitans stalactiti]|uniref:MspA family porin n=1 Tax=Antrihabitans stalactiti TaxID=2584121 RepID=A0A848KBX3_9NOCA|nr:MspA family porin [Antrihabitans stalactiti]NMN95819.1 MspA family porin [Antrihabitans stalactiti]
MGHSRQLIPRMLAIACASCAIAFLVSGTANADTVVPLPDQDKALTTATGITVELSHTGESVTISPAIAANGLSRTAWVSGTAYADTGNADKGSLETGYLVGCQVDLSAGVSLGVDVGVSTNSLSPGVSSSFALKPGQVVAVKLGSKDLDPAAKAVGYSYRNLGIQVDGCGGFAQARSYTNLSVTGGGGSTTVALYGQPFSIG